MVRMNTHFLFLEATDSGITFSKCLKKERKDQLEFFIWGNILYEWRWNKDIYSGGKKLKEFVAIEPALQEMLNNILQSEDKWNQQGTQMFRNE